MKYYKRSLMARLVSYFLLLSLASVIMIGYLGYKQASEALKDSLFKRFESIAAFKSETLNRWIEGQRENITFLAWLPEVRLQAGILRDSASSTHEYQAAYKILSEYMKTIAYKTSDTEELFVLDSNGNVIISTNKANEGHSRSRNKYFKKGKFFTYVQNVYLSAISGKPAITIATPLFNQDGQRIGVLASNLNLLRMNRLLMDRAGLGETGEAYLLDKKGHFITETMFKAVPGSGEKVSQSSAGSQGIDAALRGQNNAGRYLNYAGIPVFGVYRWLKEHDMVLAIEMSQKEAFAPARRLAEVILIVGAVTVILLAAGVYILARQIARPVLSIAETAAKVAGGDLTLKAEVSSADEIGIMARAFNKMTGQLRDSIENLEDRVAERTASLEREIIERQRIEANLYQAKKDAESANRAKSTFLANMSHELRTPMNAILGFSRIIRRDPTLAGDHQTNLAIIQRSGEHLLSLINDVLDMSKIEAGKTVLNETDFDLHRQLNDLMEMLVFRASGKGISLNIELAPDVPRYIRTDETKLRQILINLVGNAIKFTKNGGIQVSVNSERLQSEPETPSPPNDNDLPPGAYRLLFTVTDTGPGIAPEEINALFVPFAQTTTGMQARDGTGLGLPISRKFIQLMGGDISVSSEIGKGTTFDFHIRIHKAAPSDISLPCLTCRAVGLAPGQSSKKILITDDTPDNRKLLFDLLHPYDFDLREAGNGQEAVAVWREWQPDLIWMDIRMPVMDGYEAVKIIRETEKADPDRPKTVIIAQTASAFEEERATVIEAGCDDFLRKPFKDVEVFNLMEKHLGIRFIYEDEETENHPHIKNQNGPEEITPEDFPAISENLLIRLKQAAIEADMDEVDEVVHEIQPLNSDLADKLATLAENFEYEKIINFIEESV